VPLVETLGHGDPKRWCIQPSTKDAKFFKLYLSGSVKKPTLLSMRSAVCEGCAISACVCECAIHVPACAQASEKNAITLLF
jgi:hypothetical protein